MSTESDHEVPRIVARGYRRDIVPLDQRAAYSVREYAGLIGTSPDQVYDAINAGQIRAVRLGKRLLIPASELDRLLNGGIAS